ncbi:protein-ADP-ribose hydrolase [Neobacillus drentensis]|uniref:protein-ADP-ribose hydrolase n=1 Tax=Neobacillus drentensis TaxID=220684 RepID=UPI002866CF5D|nr:protein-ADP-ribose hydrolase [Neobacillus drentensis]MDR7235846.1 O-acetyl-ADP-ribose deacetylase (regulator of RNase III) [Neobacillus drentensis]
MPQLLLSDYSSFIKLNEKFVPHTVFQTDTNRIIDELIIMLLQEPDAPSDVEIPNDNTAKRNLLRVLLNIRAPKPLDERFLEKMDTLLQIELKEKSIVKVEKLDSIATMFPDSPFSHSDKFILWQGDITQLNADAIVNAANNQMLGCFQPLHACIDNAIHSAAGPQLRNDCEIIMAAQNELEDTGKAKITRAYNLPSHYVLHTVGPIVPKGTTLTNQQRNELASCYISCLEVANEMKNIKSIAFCAISTGVFGFPKTEAAYIAVTTVNDWLASHPNHFEKIIFNVFSDSDRNEYINVCTSTY